MLKTNRIAKLTTISIIILFVWLVLAVKYELDAFKGWFNNSKGYSEALFDHKKSGKSMIVYFYTDWCPHCRKFNDKVLKKSEIINFLNDKIKVQINPEIGEEEDKISQKYGVYGFPSFFVVMDNETNIQRINVSGNMSANDFINAYTNSIKPGFKSSSVRETKK